MFFSHFACLNSSVCLLYGTICSVWCMALHIWFFIRRFLLELHLYVIEYIIKNFQTNSLTYYMLFNIDYCLRKYCLLHFSRSVLSLRETTEPCNYFILFYFFMFLFYLFFTFNPLYLVHNVTKCNTWYALSSWKLTNYKILLLQHSPKISNGHNFCNFDTFSIF